MIIDGKNLIMGRLAALVAKQALLGNKVDIVNAEDIVIVGKRDAIFAKYKKKFDRKTARKGPYIPRMPDRFVRRAIRNMLPYNQDRGIQALRRIMCHIGVPDKFKNEKIEAIDNINVLNTRNIKYLTVKELCRILGRSIE